MEGFDTGALLQRLSSPLEDYQLLVLLPLCRCPIAWGVIVPYLRCWHKDRQELFCFRYCYKIVKAGIKHRFHK